MGLIGVLAALAVGVATLIAAHAGAAQARQAADLAALSAAGALSSVVAPAEPCMVAERVAESNRATLVSCVVEGEDVTVAVAVDVTGAGRLWRATAQARAGPVNPLGVVAQQP